LVALDPPSGAGKHVEIARAFLVSGEKTLSRFREDSAESAGWSNAYLLTRDIGYVFSAEELAPAVYLACELVFRQTYGIRTPESAADYAKRNDGEVYDLRRALSKRGFYQRAAPDLRAEPARLEMEDVPGRISEIVHRLSLFEGLSRLGEERDKPIRVDAPRVRTWLRQFDDEYVEPVLHKIFRTRS
jgi:hypothetical protein